MVERRLESDPEGRRVAASMVDRSYERQMSVGGREYTLASDVKSEGCQLEARQNGYLKVRGEEEIVTQEECV